MVVESINMVSQNFRNPVESLLSLSIDCLVDNLALYANKNVELLQILPSHLKNRILRRFTTSSYFWHKVNFKSILSVVLNNGTYHVDLTSAVVDDETLDMLTKCINIRKLYLSTKGGNHLTTTGLLNLLTHLKELYLLQLTHCDQFYDSVLECLVDHCPKLMGLDIRGCKNVTDIGIKKLSKLKNLTWLTFSHTQISDEGLIDLVEGPSGKKIKELRIENCSNITEVGLKAIAKNCPNLEVLMFHTCFSNDSITTAAEHLGHLKQLTWTVTF